MNQQSVNTNTDLLNRCW